MKIIMRLDDEVENEHTGDDYCCNKMKSVMKSGNFDLFYERRYGETYCTGRSLSRDFFCWDFCPFCGKNIKGKNEEYEKVLKAELGISDPYDDEVENTLPAEFKTDEWWKKREL